MMQKLCVIILWVLLMPLSLGAQTLRERMAAHVSFLASDSLQGRGLGTRGKTLARDYVVNAFVDAGLMPFHGQWLQPFGFKVSLVQVSGHNVMGYLPGTDSTLCHEWVVVGAHYDHLGLEVDSDDGTYYPGADDNASGVAMLIETARHMSMNRHRLKRGVIFVAFDAEEIGLKGSSYFVAHPPVPLSSVKVMFSCDMVGMYAKNKGVHLKGIEALAQGDPLAGALAQSHSLTVLNRGFRYEKHTDTDPFGRKGIPAVHLFTGTVSPYHQPGDQAHLLDYDGMVLLNEYFRELVLQLSEASALTPSDAYLAWQASSTRPKNFSWGLMLTAGEGHHVYDNRYYRANSVPVGSVGGYVQMNLSSHVQLQSELLYDFSGSDHPGGVFRRHSVTVPMSVKLTTGVSSFDSPQLFVLGGPWGRYHFGGDDARFSNVSSMAQYEWGLSYGAGLSVWRLQAGWVCRRAISPLFYWDGDAVRDVSNRVFFGWQF